MMPGNDLEKATVPPADYLQSRLQKAMLAAREEQIKLGLGHLTTEQLAAWEADEIITGEIAITDN